MNNHATTTMPLFKNLPVWSSPQWHKWVLRISAWPGLLHPLSCSRAGGTAVHRGTECLQNSLLGFLPTLRYSSAQSASRTLCWDSSQPWGTAGHRVLPEFPAGIPPSPEVQQCRVLPEPPAGIPPSPEGCWAEAVSVFGCCLAWLEGTEQWQGVVTATFQDLQVCLNVSEVTCPKPTWLRWKFSLMTRKRFQLVL